MFILGIQGKEKKTAPSLRSAESSTIGMMIPVGVLSLLVILVGVFPSPWVDLVNHVMYWMLVSI